MRRIDGDRSEQRVQLAIAIVGDKRALFRRQVLHADHADALVRQRRPQGKIPAAILVAHELVRELRDQLRFLLRRAAVGAGFGLAVFNALHQATHADFEELVQIAGGDGEELHPLQQRIARVLRFLQHTAIERQPRGFAVQHQGRIIQGTPDHTRGADLMSASFPMLHEGYKLGRAKSEAAKAIFQQNIRAAGREFLVASHTVGYTSYGYQQRRISGLEELARWASC